MPLGLVVYVNFPATTGGRSGKQYCLLILVYFFIASYWEESLGTSSIHYPVVIGITRRSVGPGHWDRIVDTAIDSLSLEHNDYSY